MNYNDYTAEGLRQLSDINFYQKLEVNPTEKHRREAQVLIQKFISRDVSDFVYNYLLDKKCRTPNLYLLPNIHIPHPHVDPLY